MSAVFAVPALAAQPKVIFSNLATSATSNVPGMSGWRFRPGIAVDTTLLHFVTSPDGSQWALVGWMQNGTTERMVIVKGSGTGGANGTVVARVGGNSHLAGRQYDALQTGLAVNDAGSVLFAGSVTGTTTDDTFVARWSNSVYMELAREGLHVPGQAAGVNYGSVIDCSAVTSVGSGVIRTLVAGGSDQVWLRADSVTTGTAIAQSNVTVPAGQLFAPPQSIFMFDYNQIVADGAATHSLARARLNGDSAHDHVVMFDGSVVLQNAAALPGSGLSSAVGNLATYSWGLSISPAGGHWAVVGSNLDFEDWVLADGRVAAVTGMPVMPGSSEVFDDARWQECFVGVSVTSSGTIAVGAHTNSDITQDTVIAIPGERVLLREGDGVDLNGNGALDDGVFVGDLAPGCVVLTDSQRLFAVISLRDSARSVLGVALITMDAAACNDIDFNNDAIFPDVSDVADFLAVFGGGTCPTGICDGVDFNRDGIFPDVEDISMFLRVFSGGSCS